MAPSVVSRSATMARPSPSGPTYLVRFDDICPTMRWDTWDAVERVLHEYDIKPILAVIPNAQDPELRLRPARPDFWDRVREWQTLGWTIALHGYQHRYVNGHGGMLKRTPRSEFAGLPLAEQERKLRLALDIFEREAVRAGAWVAPSHSFDHHTVRALGRVGLRVISDGPWRWPGTDARGMFWIPQQLCEFRQRPPGIWTVCLHPNSWSAARCEQMLRALQEYAPLCTTVPEVVRAHAARRLGPVHWVWMALDPWRQACARSAVRLLRWARRTSRTE